jgi:hypothetical protein
MRIILDVFRPDQAQITWNSAPVGEVPRSQWGCLPEERGLSPKVEASAQGIAASSRGGGPGYDLLIQIANRSIDHDLQ